MILKCFHNSYLNLFLRHIPDMDATHVQDFFVDASQTSNVGTALYVAPELNILGPKAVYNEVSVHFLHLIKLEYVY